MPRTRGAANEALYRASILLDSWDRAREAEAVAAEPLRQAFLPAVRLHLHRAYGWFLLSVSGIEDAGEADCPRSTADLAAPEAGRERAPELREFALLESGGWIGDMLAPQDSAATPAAGGALLLGSDQAPPGFAVASDWHRRLGAIMARMDDSLAEC